MTLLNDLNLNSLRIFESVFRTRSMTAAAKELHMTQSGVSQHIKGLEQVLGVPLFDRIQRRVVPTSEGALLFEQCASSLRGLDELVTRFRGHDKRLTGKVSIGMPIEFGNNVIIPLVSKFCRANPGVSVQFKLGFAKVMNELLLSGALDFALVDEYRMDRRVRTEKVYGEVLELCIAPGALPAGAENRELFESLSYVEYGDETPLLGAWFDHHLGKSRPKLDVRATIMDVQGVARLILGEVGAGILPGHLVAKMRREGARLHCFKGSGKPCQNHIYLAHLTERTLSAPSRALLTHLKAGLKV